MTTLERAVHELSRRAGRLVAVSLALRWSAYAAFAWGTAILVARGVAEPAPAALASGALALPLVVSAAIVAGRRRRPSDAAVRALLDREGERGGLVMTSAEVPLGPWAEAADGRPPSIRLRRRGGGLGLLSAGGLYVVAAWIVPTNAGLLAEERRLDVARPAEELEAQVEALRDQGLIEKDEADRLEQALERIAAEAKAADPARAWEALDQVRDAVEKAAGEAAEATAAGETALAATVATAEALSGGSGEPALRASGLAELAELAAQAAAIPGLDPETAAELAELAKGLAEGSLAALDPQLLAELRAAAKRGLGELREVLGRLARAGLREGRPEAAASDSTADEALLAFLDSESKEASAALCRLAGAGRGGVDRGRGDAELTWKDPASREGSAFREESLPRRARLDRSRLVGIDAVDPSGLEPGRGSLGGALSESAAGGGSAHTQTVLPRHRGAVRRYFDRPDGGPR